MPYSPERHGPHRIVGPGFFEQVFGVVARVPKGHVTTYGDVAAELGMRSIARKVGHALAGLDPDRTDVPWHRVINSQGKVSRPADSSSGQLQRQLLIHEGVEVATSGRILDFDSRRYSYPKRP